MVHYTKFAQRTAPNINAIIQIIVSLITEISDGKRIRT